MKSAAELRDQANQPLDPSTPQTYEIRDRQEPEQKTSPSQRPASATNAPTNEDYTPDPAKSLSLPPTRQAILDAVLNLYSGSGTNDSSSTGTRDIRVYAHRAVYDDVWSYCDTRYKIAGQWWGIPLVMSSSETLAVQVVSSTEKRSASSPAELVFKMKRAWTPKLLHKTFEVNHFVTLSLEKAVDEDGEGSEERIRYHKDQWNEKDYSHDGLGKIMKTLNGDFATIGTMPPKDL